MRKIFRAKTEEMAVGWRRLHNEELCNVRASRVIISKGMRWAGHGRDEKFTENFGRETRREETTRKI